VLLAAGIPSILLPWDNAEVFQRNYESSALDRMATWTAWVAPTTMKVSDAARRAGMSKSDFRAINSIPPRMMIKAGSALLIPRSAQIGADVTAGVADNGRLDLSPEQSLKRITVKASKQDTINSLAKRHNVKPDQLAEWNKLPESANLKAGQSLVLYVAGKSTGKKMASKPNDKTVAAKKKPNSDTRVAKK
jgi:membrane-bound lytic murein transglycosylase D